MALRGRQRQLCRTPTASAAGPIAAGGGRPSSKVRSLAAESSRAFQGGPLEPTFYQKASLLSSEAGSVVSLEDLDDFILPRQYTHTLDWFAVDLEGEHSAMDGRILEEHTEYVVQSIHWIMDQYQESHKSQLQEETKLSGSLPTSVILVGHSMGLWPELQSSIQIYGREQLKQF